MSDREMRVLAAAGVAGGVRVEATRWQGNVVYKVATVALVADIVVQGLHSDGPEFIPADVLASAPQSWDGSPVTTWHANGGNVATPEVLEAEQIGTVFHTFFDNGALQCELFIDPLLCARQGEDGI